MKVVCELEGRSVELDDGVLEPHLRASAELGDVRPARLVYAAAHLVMRDSYAEVPHSLDRPAAPSEVAAHVDWQATDELRIALDRFGFGIAEAMDTAQRFQIGWENARQLIERTGAADLANGFIAGAGADHLDVVPDEDALVEAVVFQARVIQQSGGLVILLPLPWLCQTHSREDDYVRVYRRIVSSLDGPIFVHWLGPMFMPALAGYFPGDSFRRVMALDPEKVRGAKLSLLDAELERSLRLDLLARDQILLTGDDFSFGALLEGGPVQRHVRLLDKDVPLGDFSHALLGIFDAIARPASVALRLLAAGRVAEYRQIMGPCEQLGRHLFMAPTQHYKAGLSFLAWLNGTQGNRMLVQHEERARDTSHLLEAARLASLAGVLRDASLAGERLREMVTRRR